MAQKMRTGAVAGLKAFQFRGITARWQLLRFVSHFGASSSSSPLLQARTSDVNADQQPSEEQRNMFHIDRDSHSESIVLPDGRRIGIAYYGAQSGPTVFYLHGFPGCRLSGVFFDKPGKRLGARIIAVDRPGIGISSPQPGREALDHANDIRDLAEYLQLDSYGVIGVSGGGPYALACAYSLPEEKLRSVSILAGMGPIDVGLKGMNWGNWFVFKSLMYFPALYRWLQKKTISVLNSLSNEKLTALIVAQNSKPSSKWFSNGKDLEILTNPSFLTTMLSFYREHYQQGMDGHMEDGRILTSDWGFRVKDIRSSIPIQLWYSRKDTNVPLRMGEAIATRLNSPPNFHIIDDETHLSVVLKYSSEALEGLLKKM